MSDQEISADIASLVSTPVVTRLDDAARAQLRAYFERLAEEGIKVADAEALRLTPYLQALSEQLREDFDAVMGREAARVAIINARRNDAAAAEVKRQNAPVVDAEQILATPQGLRRMFNRVAQQSRNVVLSEMMLAPEGLLRNGEVMGNALTFAGASDYKGLSFTLGFIQLGQLTRHSDQGPRNGTVSVPLFGFSDKMMASVANHAPERMLRAFQTVMTAGNHDMQHHYTNDILNPNISYTSTQRPLQDEFSVDKWQNRYFIADGDRDPKSYESWLMLNHARVRSRFDGGEQGARLETAIGVFFDELKRIAGEIAALNGDGVAHRVADYFNATIGFALMRYLPFTHPLMEKALAGMAAADRLPDHSIEDGARARDWLAQNNHLEALRGVYLQEGLDITPDRLDHAAAMRLQLAQMEPWIAKLMAPGAVSARIGEAKARREQVNVEMVEAAASTAWFVPKDGLYEISMGWHGRRRVWLKDGDLHHDSEPALVDTDGSRRTEKWYLEGHLARRDGGPVVIESAPGQRCEKYLDMQGDLHREDGPALIEERGGDRIETWYKYGSEHREGGPAYRKVFADGGYEDVWQRFGARHRLDGPAHVCDMPNAGVYEEEWFRQGKLHRDGGPARIFRNGKMQLEEWKQDGVFHRADGPAYAFANHAGEEVRKWYNAGKLHRVDGPALEEVKDGERRTEWHKHGVLHNETAPALVEDNGRGGIKTEWYRNGQLHRDGGPACVKVKSDGTRVERWLQNGQRHRLDGPAQVNVEADGKRTEEWFVNGERLSGDAPGAVVISPDGTRRERWYVDGELGRAGGLPAMVTVHPDGRRVEEWIKDNLAHRDDGPAIVTQWPDGRREERWMRKGRNVEPGSQAPPPKPPRPRR